MDIETLRRTSVELVTTEDQLREIVECLLSCGQSRNYDWEIFYDRCRFIKLSELFIREYSGFVVWSDVCFKQDMSIDFLRECENSTALERFKYYSSWNILTDNKDFTEELIEEFKDKMEWSFISKHQKLSENFIRKYWDRVYWYNICEYQQLSEPFIEEFKDIVIWDYIFKYQSISRQFMEKWKNKAYSMYRWKTTFDPALYKK